MNALKKWYLAINDDFFPISVYHVLLRRGISKEKLDEDYNRYRDFQRREKNVKLKNKKKKQNA